MYGAMWHSITPGDQCIIGTEAYKCCIKIT